MKKLLVIFTSLCLWSIQVLAQTGTGSSTLVSIGSDGKLKYTPDAKGNVVPDYSAVGYKSGDVAIPTVAVVKTISAVAGDNTTNIQNAINAVAALPMDANGIRGALLLKAGTYNINNTIYIRSSGVILRGEGNSTILMATKTSQYDLISVTGSGGPSVNTSTSKQLQGSYIPVGAKTFTLPAGHGFVVGDDVMLQRKPNQAWIHMLGMDVLSQIPCDNGGCNTDWTPADYTVNYIRKITAVNGNTITLDAPNVDVIDSKYAQGFLMKFTWSGKIENVGVENMYIDSKYTNVNDESHGWNAVSFSNSKNGWATNVEVHHFGYSAVTVNESAAFISVLSCKNLDPISQTIGGRKYSFNITGQRNLVKNCTTRSGRHDYVTGAQTAGPNVFVRSTATNQQADIGPHQRWATGALFDVLTSNSLMDAQNRLGYGTGHGWSGSQMMYWNCTSAKFIVQSPPNHMNWTIGCKGTVTDVGDEYTGSPCINQSQGNFIAGIPSLYEKQLADRLNTTPVDPNKLPTVSLTSPLATDAFTAPASVTISATAADADGTISTVDFYNGTTLLSSDATAPYSFAWTSVAAGTYSISAKATDNSGATTTSAVVSITVAPAPPVCLPASASGDDGNVATNVLDNNLATRWSANGDGQWIQFCQGTAINISGVQIAFYSGNARQSIFDVQVSQDGQIWSNVLTGVHSSGTSLALENFIFATQSAKYLRLLGHGNTVNTWNSYTEVKILTGEPPVNQLPSVAITAPTNNASFNAPASIAITATAADVDGTVSKVDFYNGTTLLSTDATAPYAYTWSAVAIGTYSITAVATDNAGGVTTSTAISIVVVAAPANIAPTITLTAPSNNASVNAPASIAITATAADADGTISKVDFYNGTTLLFSDNTSPYAYTWANVAAGTYVISAKATDNSGATTTSATASVKVNTVVVTNPCSSLATYKENGGYDAGTKVQNVGKQYQCKPYPYSGWCNGSAWAYAPGTGSYWTDAWTLVGSCSSSREANAEVNESLLTNAPNPFSSFTNLTIVVSESGNVSVNIYNKSGLVVKTVTEGHLTPGTYDFNVDTSDLPADLYIVKYTTESASITKKIIRAQ